MSFSDWIGEDPDTHGDTEAGPADDFTHRARLRAQAERESNRLRRRRTWRSRAELLRRKKDRAPAQRRG